VSRGFATSTKRQGVQTQADVVAEIIADRKLREQAEKANADLLPILNQRDLFHKVGNKYLIHTKDVLVVKKLGYLLVCINEQGINLPRLSALITQVTGENKDKLDAYRVYEQAAAALAKLSTGKIVLSAFLKRWGQALSTKFGSADAEFTYKQWDAILQAKDAIRFKLAETNKKLGDSQ